MKWISFIYQTRRKKKKNSHSDHHGHPDSDWTGWISSFLVVNAKRLLHNEQYEWYKFGEQMGEGAICTLRLKLLVEKMIIRFCVRMCNFSCLLKVNKISLLNIILFLKVKSVIYILWVSNLYSLIEIRTLVIEHILENGMSKNLGKSLKKVSFLYLLQARSHFPSFQPLSAPSFSLPFPLCTSPSPIL